MGNINSVCLSGRLTRDSELRVSQTGMQVLSIGMAVNDRIKDSTTGEWQDKPNFIDCKMFGKRAESIAQYLTKGTQVFIEGKLRWSQWESDGQKRSKVEVIVNEIEFQSRQQQGQQQTYTAQPVYEPKPQQQQGLYDQDIPF